jgi:hypothetical protein
LTEDLEPARALQIEAYHEALDLLTSGNVDGAEARWRSLVTEAPDAVVDRWLRLIENLRTSGLSWDGVWRLTEKG